MLMRSVLLMFAFLFCISSRAQINITTSGNGQAPYSKAHRQRLMQELKRSTTIFILQYRDYNQLAAYEKAIKESWTYTPFKIIRPEELQSYEGKKGFTFFTFGAYYTGKHHSTQHFVCGLWTPVLNRRERLKSQFFYSSIFLYPEPTIRLSMLPYSISRHKYDAKLMNDVLDKARFYNWNAVFLKGYLQTTNAFLTRNENLGVWKSYENEKLHELKTDTLYIPDYVKTKEEFWHNRRYIDTVLSEASIKADYPYPVKFVSTNDLSLLLADSTHNIHYLVFTVDGADKYISVYSSKDGLLYAFTRLMSWTFKNKDLAQLAKSVD